MLLCAQSTFLINYRFPIIFAFLCCFNMGQGGFICCSSRGGVNQTSSNHQLLVLPWLCQGSLWYLLHPFWWALTKPPGDLQCCFPFISWYTRVQIWIPVKGTQLSEYLTLKTSPGHFRLIHKSALQKSVLWEKFDSCLFLITQVNGQIFGWTINYYIYLTLHLIMVHLLRKLNGQKQMEYITSSL